MKTIETLEELYSYVSSKNYDLKSLEKDINTGGFIDYTNVWKKIPGNFSMDKASWLLNNFKPQYTLF